MISHLLASLSSTQNLEYARFIVGVLGNMVSVLLYLAPTLTFRRVVKRKSTEDFSCVPYVSTLLNSVIYILYGSPVVSHNWDNLLLVTINSFGLIMELSFITIYFYFSSSNGKKTVALIIAPVMTFCAAMLVSTIEMDDRHLRKAMVGSFGFVSSVAMYGSPLVAVKQVIETKSVEFMPFYLSLFSFLTSSLWLAYGLLSNDVLLASPCFLGCPLGVLQLVVYYIYKKEIREEPCKVDLENGDQKDLITPLICDVSEIRNE